MLCSVREGDSSKTGITKHSQDLLLGHFNYFFINFASLFFQMETKNNLPQKIILHETFKRHTRVKTGEKPFKCDVWENVVLYISALTRHKKLHTGEKPYSCKMLKAFSQQSTLTICSIVEGRREGEYREATLLPCLFVVLSCYYQNTVIKQDTDSYVPAASPPRGQRGMPFPPVCYHYHDTDKGLCLSAASLPEEQGGMFPSSPYQLRSLPLSPATPSHGCYLTPVLTPHHVHLSQALLINNALHYLSITCTFYYLY